MKIKLYDRVRLKDGRTAQIVEIYNDGKAFEADIDLGDSEWETDTIKFEDIQEITQ